MSDIFEIHLQGHLDLEWEAWFGGLTFQHLPDGTTLLRGEVADQPALQGLLLRISQLGLSILRVERIKEERKMAELQVVLGGSGGLGRAVVTRLARQGNRVRAVNRGGQIADLPDRVEVQAADALKREDMVGACAGAGVVYHCVHPNKDYSQFTRMTENIVAGAEAAGAKLIMAASVYPYGKVDGPMTEDLPHRPEAPSGEYHARAADLVKAAHAAGRVQAAIGRASNYFGPHAPRMWPGIDFRAAVAGERMQIIGKTEPLHTYTYVYDFADGLITLGEQDRALGEAWHLPSAATVTTQAFLDMIYAEAGTRPDVLAGPRLILQLMSLFNAELRPALEVFYQFDRPFVVDHSKFESAFGADPTPHSEAIAATVGWAKGN